MSIIRHSYVCNIPPFFCGIKCYYFGIGFEINKNRDGYTLRFLLFWWHLCFHLNKQEVDEEDKEDEGNKEKKTEENEKFSIKITTPCEYNDGMHVMSYAKRIVRAGGEVIENVMYCKKCKRYVRCGGQPQFYGES